MSGLYQLSFVLTANHEKAEQCFVASFEDCVKGNPVPKQWALSWAKLAIIQNALKVINSRPWEENAPSRFNNSGGTLGVEDAEMIAVLELEPVERFVYVMSVLERFSDQYCSVLLNCVRGDLIAARIRALQQVGSAMDVHLMR
jgi:hypothetical protein